MNILNRIYLNEEWQFTPNFKEEILSENYQPVDMENVRIPHTVKELPYNYFDEADYQMVSAYRRMLVVPKEYEGKHLLLTFEGVAHEAELFVNGTSVCKHSCGYTAFTVDIAPYVTIGEANVLVLKVDSRESINVPPFGFVIDYMTYGGVYREVYLEVKEPTYIEDAFVKSDIVRYKSRSTADVNLVCRMKIKEIKTGLNYKVYMRQAQTSVQHDLDERFREWILIGENHASEENVVFEVAKEDVILWSVTNPALYEVKVELRNEEVLLDTKEVRFGFRSMEFKTDGFYLNNQKFKIRGLNRHQSYPYVGYAMPESMQNYDADILKYELGCNAVRTSHYPQSHYFINRCDEIGLLVFMEIPGWQHIGNEEWKQQACVNVHDMVTQYRNHASIMIWGVRINESGDDDEFYTRTNRIAHELDDSRPTGGVRNFKKSHLLEDVYTYNDFLHNGTTRGCEPKKKVTSNMSKPYLITEYNGHMYPTKTFDWEEHRAEHALRHARVLDTVAGETDISGSFGWCMFDYNTHKDFGSGDRICYHGVLDMFRNAKLAAANYSIQQEDEIILELSSTMDIGEHPETNIGPIYIYTNADSVRMYKNGTFIKEYTNADSSFKNLKHGPILMDDFVGDMMETREGYSPALAKKISYAMNYIAVHGFDKFPPKILLIAAECILVRRIKPSHLISLYTRYVGNWGETATEYRFEAIKNGKVVKTVVRQPMKKAQLEVKASTTSLQEKSSYDVAAIRIRAIDENKNLLPFFLEPVRIQVEGPVEIIGPDVISLKGGMGGTYIRTTGDKGTAKVTFTSSNLESKTCVFDVE